ncbi:MAG TPA: arginine--tRNA ligase [Lautropia sp.]|nr:arginine--tRNA ligase [Lautropia sp.]
MLQSQIDHLVASFREAATAVGVDALTSSTANVVLDRPRQQDHGDVACNLALQIARLLKRPPREVAASLLEAFLRIEAGRLVARGETAGPGFINLWLKPEAKQAVVGAILRDAEAFGNRTQPAAEAVLLEFVSANPTGPLHVGHGRQAALGDVLGNILASQGWRVVREFYYNDAGAQINNLALSVQARCRGIAPQDDQFPADGYRGDYISDIAQDYLNGRSVAAASVGEVTAAGDPEDLEAIRRFAVASLRHEQDLDLQAFGVAFDRYYLESSLYGEGLVDRTVVQLKAAGKTYDKDGALWLRTTGYGDDKDRVMRKSDGSYTYFVPDVAYHTTKWARGFAKAINIQGSDHHGTIARVRAGLQALDCGIPPGYPDYVLHKMVRVFRGGEEVKISKRAGSFVALRDLIEWSGDGDMARGRDAVRYFLVSRKADSEFTFDVDLALQRSDENPVYYVQYAHARISSILAADSANGRPVGEPALELLTTPHEYAVMARLASFPAVLAQASDELSPHHLAYYLKDLAADFHAYYNSDRVLVDDPALRGARLALLLAVRMVLRRGLSLIGVSAPEKM